MKSNHTGKRSLYIINSQENYLNIANIISPEEILAMAQKDPDLGKLQELLKAHTRERRTEIDRILGEIIQAVMAELQSTVLKAENDKGNARDALVGTIFSKDLEDRIQVVLLKQKIHEDSMLTHEIVETIRIVTARGLVLGEAMRPENAVSYNFDQLSPAARILLSNQTLMGQLAKMTFSQNAAVDAVFVERADPKEVKAWIRQGDQRMAVPFNSEMPHQAAFARNLVKLFLGVTAIAYSDPRPLTGMSLRRAGMQGGDFFGLFLNEGKTGFHLQGFEENSAWADTDAVRSASSVLGWENSLNFFELLLKNQFLKKEDGRSILDRDAVNRGIEFINALAAEAVRQKLISQAA